MASEARIFPVVAYSLASKLASRHEMRNKTDLCYGFRISSAVRSNTSAVGRPLS